MKYFSRDNYERDFSGLFNKILSDNYSETSCHFIHQDISLSSFGFSYQLTNGALHNVSFCYEKDHDDVLALLFVEE